VEDLRDSAGVCQGEPGYSNHIVHEGDRLVAIDGVTVLDLPVAELHRLLLGPDRSMVRLSLMGTKTHSVYRIDVMRHTASHAAEPSAPPDAGQNGGQNGGQHGRHNGGENGGHNGGQNGGHNGGEKGGETAHDARRLQLIDHMRGLPIKATSGFVGLNVTKEPPHTIQAVEDLRDSAGVCQGEPGYSNHIVHEGDRLVAIDGVTVLNLPVAELHRLLLGPDRSMVRLSLMGKMTHSVYRIAVLRHRAHAFDPGDVV